MRASILALLAALACAAQAPPEIRVDVSLVNVAFTVRDANGTLASGLGKDDFEVREDGVLQKVQFFARAADTPLTLGLLLDGSGSQEHFFRQHHHDVQTFLEEVLRPRDQAFLIGFGNSLRLAADLTPSPAVLMEGLKAYEHDVSRIPIFGPREIRELGTAFYDAIYYSVTNRLAAASGGRRALVLLSDGEDNSSAHNMMETVEACQRADVSVFGVRYTERRRGRLTARNKYGTGVIARLAKETGGADFDAEQDDLRTSFRRIGADLRSSYELAYVPSSPVPDGTFRKLNIRVKNPGYSVRCKTGYFAEEGGKH